MDTNTVSGKTSIVSEQLGDASKVFYSLEITVTMNNSVKHRQLQLKTVFFLKNVSSYYEQEDILNMNIMQINITTCKTEQLFCRALQSYNSPGD